MSLLDTASLIVTPNGYKASKLYSIVPSNGAGDMDVTRATTATRVNPSGLIESVATNVPRIDYTGSTCPSILVEPQRTNLNTYSEDFTNGVYNNENTTITTNSTTAPDGTATADKLVITGSGITSIHREVSTTSGNYYTASVYVKKAETQYVNLGFIYNAIIYAGTQFDLNNGTVKTNRSSGYTGLSSTITNVGNGWYRLTVTCIINTAVAFPTILPSNAEWTSGEPRQNLTGNNTTGAYFWGLQMELGAYATSYIPTVATSVTRNADVISKTGISSLIGQTEGTVFLDFVARGGDVNQEILGVTLSGGGSEYIALYSLTNGALYFVTNLTGGVLIDASSFGERFKVAYSFNSGNHVLYVNGVQIYSSTISGVYSLLNAFYLGANAVGAGQQLLNTNSSALWKTRLTNSELATLTTI